MIYFVVRALITDIGYMERYRSGHNEAVLKTVCPQGRVGSNPTLSALKGLCICKALWRFYYAGRTGKDKMKKRFMFAAFLLTIALVGSMFLYYHSPIEDTWLICIIYKLSGYYCPGCGSGRACYSILHGKFYQAFRFNPLLCILLPWLALYIGISGVQWLLYGRETISRKIPVWVPYVLLAVVILYGILRNIDIYPFTLLAPVKEV